MKYFYGFSLICILSLSSSHSQALSDNLLIAPETVWFKALDTTVGVTPHQVIVDTSEFDIHFEPDYSNTLLERGDLSVSRKILMNAAGTEFNPALFQFDLHLELSYKFI